MIVVTRLNGVRLALNSDLLERVEATPDTVLTLADGSKFVVRESLDEVVDRVRTFRASVLAAADVMARRAGESTPTGPELRLLPQADGED